MAASANVEQVSKALNVTVRRVNQLVHEGMPRAERGAYDLGGCMLWYIRYLQGLLRHKATEDEDGGASSIRDQRKRLLTAQADREELDLAEARKRMVTVEDWEKATADIVAAAKARLLAVPARVAPRVLGETSRVLVQGIIEKEIKEALQALGEAK